MADTKKVIPFSKKADEAKSGTDKKTDTPAKATEDGKTVPAAADKAGDKKTETPAKATEDGKAKPTAADKAGDKKTGDPAKPAEGDKTAPAAPNGERVSMSEVAYDESQKAENKGGEGKKDNEPAVNPKNLKLEIGAKEADKVTMMNISEIQFFEGHPFKVEDNKDMYDLAESIKMNGVLEPAVVIPRKEGGYEMVSGHRRMRASQLAGLTTMPVIVRNLDRDEAVISMVDANLKRENISPMEKARAYEMKLEAMKRKAGRRSKMDILAGKEPLRADEELAQQTGESRATVQRMVRLTKLEPELQQMVDDKKLPVNTAADISYMKPAEQKELVEAIKSEDKVPSGAQAAELKKASQEGKLTSEIIKATVAPPKKEMNPELKVTLTNDELRPYFPDKRATVPDVKKGIFEALQLRQKAIQRREQKAAQSAEEKDKGTKPEKTAADSKAPAAKTDADKKATEPAGENKKTSTRTTTEKKADTPASSAKTASKSKSPAKPARKR